MGNGASKEEQLYQAVQNGNSKAVEALRHEGASLEFVDKVRCTPLHVACTRGDLFEMTLTLLNLGANVNAYQPGTHGGTPLHLAAKFGLDRTVFLLLQRGADPLAVNDDVLTPLDLARNRCHLSVVRMIEDRVTIFTGMLREMAGPGFLEQFAPQWITKKIWAVVVPTESDPRKPPKSELVIYLSPKNSLPRTLIPLSRAEVEEPKFSLPDPVLVLTDKSTKTKYKFLAEAPGDKAQIERLYKACKGVEQDAPVMPSQALLQGLSALIRPAAQQQQPQPPQATPSSSNGPNPGNLEQPSGSDVALRMAMEASLRTAAEEQQRLGGWEGDGEHVPGSEFNGWDLSAGAGPSSGCATHGGFENAPEPEKVPIAAHDPAETLVESTSRSFPPPPSLPSAASAPPLAPVVLEQESGAISYPSIDTSPVEIDYSAYVQPVQRTASASAPAPASPAEGEKAGSQGGLCVVCWDAPAQAVCIPCGHLAGCMDCLSEIKEKGWGCPVCRAPIQQVIKVYAV